MLAGCCTPAPLAEKYFDRDDPLGALKGFTAPQLGALVVREAVARAGIEPASVDECLMGNVVQAGVGQNPARQAALGGGLDPRVSATTINQVCGSGLKAVMLASQAIEAGDSRIVVAGGMESMSRAPYLLPGAREGQRLGNAEMIDSVILSAVRMRYARLRSARLSSVRNSPSVITTTCFTAARLGRSRS